MGAVAMAPFLCGVSPCSASSLEGRQEHCAANSFDRPGAVTSDAHFGKHQASVLGSSPLPCLRWMSSELHAGLRPDCPPLAEDVPNELGTGNHLHTHHQNDLARNENFCPDQLGPDADVETYASLLRRAKSLPEGQRVHEQMTRHGLTGDRFLNNLLVQMYSKCGSVEYARAVFDGIGHRNLYTWNIMIAAYAQNGHGKEALQLFGQMQADAFEPDKITMISVLNAIASVAALEEGREIHAIIVCTGLESDIVVGNALVNIYGKCRSLGDSRAVFALMPLWDVVSWSALISACAQNGHGKEALQLFGLMQEECFMADKVTFICVVDACASVPDLEEGREIHATSVGNGWELNIVLGNALVNMYGKCGILDDSRAVFTEMPLRDLISWNSMLAACAQNGSDKEALELFGQMQAEDLKPNKITFSCVVDSCANAAALEKGREMHATIVGDGCHCDEVVGTALINMHGKCGCLDDSRVLFEKMPVRNVVCWSTMITMFAQYGQGKEALELFGRMQAEGIKPDCITFLCILDACISMAALEQGQEIHTTIVSRGWDLDIVVGNTLINMYGKCGSLDDSWAVFTEMPLLNVVSLSAIVGAYAHNGCGKEALQLFDQVQACCAETDKVLFICILDACAIAGALIEGQEIHGNIVRYGWESDVVVANALVNMYGNCRSLDDSRAVFLEMPLRDVVSWTTMMTFYAQNGHGKEALRLFNQMQREGVKPDKVAFISVLTACSHTGLVADGKRHFVSMNRDHGITPCVEHYIRMIDLFGRGGLLEEAEDLIMTMPFECNSSAWLSLLSSCRIHGDIERAVHAANFSFQLDPRNASPYVLLANIHAYAGMLDDVLEVRKGMVEMV